MIGATKPSIPLRFMRATSLLADGLKRYRMIIGGLSTVEFGWLYSTTILFFIVEDTRRNAVMRIP
jgi:hypothetical protein